MKNKALVGITYANELGTKHGKNNEVFADMVNNVPGLNLDLNKVNKQQQGQEYSQALEKPLQYLQIPEGVTALV